MDILGDIVANGFDAELVEAVLKRLESFEYTTVEEDVWVIGFTIQKIENTIKNDCNLAEIPKGLFNVAVDMVCSEILKSKTAMGKLEIESLNLDSAIKSIREGDTQVEYNTGVSQSALLNDYISNIAEKYKGEMVCYRRLHW